MAFKFMDLMETIAPMAVSFIPGIGIPAAIALSAATKGGITAAKGGGAGEILRDAALGAAGGAGGAAMGGALSKGLGEAAGKAVEKGGEAATKAFANAGETGFAEATKTAMGELAKAQTKRALLDKGAQLTAGALGKDPGKTQNMLKTIQSGGKVVGAIDQAYQTMMPENSFMRHQQAMTPPGFTNKYQYGAYGQDQGNNNLSLGFGRYY
jgi:hypothetical protein